MVGLYRHGRVREVNPGPAALDPAYDLLISYRRADGSFARQLADRLSQQHGLRVFLDEKAHVPGYHWREFWTRALEHPPALEFDPTVGPGVLVLVTRAMADAREAGADVVVEEIGAALEAQERVGITIPIHALRFDAAGYEELSKRVRSATGVALGSWHEIRGLEGLPVEDPGSLTPAQWKTICDAAIRVARASVLRRAAALRAEAFTWARRLLDRRLCADLGLEDETSAARAARDVVEEAVLRGERSQFAIVGDGGTGKSMELARLLGLVARVPSSRLHPVLVTTEDLVTGLEAVRERLGLGRAPGAEPLSELSEVHAWSQLRLVFVVDGLERGVDSAAAMQRLLELRDAGGLWVTCRSAPWQRSAMQLQFEEREVLHQEELTDEVVGRHLGIDPAAVGERPYLRQALFLDLALHLIRSREGVGLRPGEMRSQTAALDALFARAIRDPAGARSRQELAEFAAKILERLACAQLARAALWIPRDVVVPDADWVLPGWRGAFERLRDEGRLLVEEPRTVDAKSSCHVRLRHDVIDAHNLGSQALAAGPTDAAVQLWLESGFGQLVCEGISQLAADRSLPGPVEQLFRAFVLACDNKEYSPWNARAWGGTFLVQSKLGVFLPHIVRCMGGAYLGNRLASRPGEAVSQLSPPALTRDALSSVASTLLGAPALSLDDEQGEALAAFTRALGVAERKARLVEAVARFKSPNDGALAVLTALAGNKDLIHDDATLSAYIAAALREIVERGGTIRQAQVALGALDALEQTCRELVDVPDGIDRPTLREIRTARDAVCARAGRQPGAREPMTERELVQGLSLHAYGKPSDLSDWRVFRRYANRVVLDGARVDGAVNTEVLLALGAGLWHDQMASRVDAARALGTADHPFARGLLLHALANVENDRLEETVLEAVRAQGKRLDARGRQLFGLALRRAAAERGRRHPRSLQEGMREALVELGVVAGTLVTENCIEMAPIAPGARLVAVSAPDAQRPGPAGFVLRAAAGDPGPETEQKIRLRFAPAGASRLLDVVQYDAAAWREGRGFHMAVEKALQEMPDVARESFRQLPNAAAARHDARLRMRVEAIARLHAWMEESLEGGTPAPGLGAIHAIVLTEDGRIIEGRRATTALTDPGRWSASFEEQIRVSDLEAQDALLATTLRGFEEEFGVRLEPGEISILKRTLFLEWPILNAGIAVVARVARACDALLPGTGDGELDSVRGVTLEERLGSLRSLGIEGFAIESGEPWHGTSAARAELLRLALTR